MARKKQKKRIFSEEEKLKIRELKNGLLAKGIPREEWGSIIQQDLTLQRLKNKDTKIYEEKVESLSPLKRFRENFLGFIKKVVLKRINVKNDALMKKMFEDSMEGVSGEEMELEDLYLPNFKKNNIEKLKNHGTFITDRPDKKRMIVDLDDEDEKK